MTVNEYQELALRVIDKDKDVDKKDMLINGAMGLCSESGEAINIVKKYLTQATPLDRSKLAEELGDIVWYVAETATALGLDLEDVLVRNIGKLKMRRPEAYDDSVEIKREESRISKEFKVSESEMATEEKLEELLHPTVSGRVLSQSEIDWLISVFDMVKDKLG